MSDLKSFSIFFVKFFACVLILLLGVVLFISYFEKLRHEPPNSESLDTKATSLKIVEINVLGAKIYSETCPRFAYIDNVETVLGEDGGSSSVFDFKFRPSRGNEKKCPAVIVRISRDTGETWIMNLEK